MSKIQLTFQDENIINSIDLDHNSLPLNSSKRIANFRNNVFLRLWEFFLTSLSPPPPFSRQLFSQVRWGHLIQEIDWGLARLLTTPKRCTPHPWRFALLIAASLPVISPPLLPNSWEYPCDPCHTT